MDENQIKELAEQIYEEVKKTGINDRRLLAEISCRVANSSGLNIAEAVRVTHDLLDSKNIK